MNQRSTAIWKRIPSYHHLEASSNGEIRRVDSQAHLNAYITQNYIHVQIDAKHQATVHKLVLESVQWTKTSGKVSCSSKLGQTR